MDFQINDETYFLSLADGQRGWEVFVSTPTGARPIPVYVDAPESEGFVVVQEDRHRRPN